MLVAVLLSDRGGGGVFLVVVVMLFLCGWLLVVMVCISLVAVVGDVSSVTGGCVAVGDGGCVGNSGWLVLTMWC